jgi:AraC family transcriptional regulator, regulatory protein of adaptative response / DNA-3-methyladenine glycosylase II
VNLDPEQCFAAARSKDGRFDGQFYIAVTSTRIYCRPSCPAVSPKRSNMRFYPTAAAAQEAGFRACKRCRPDAAPGSPEWNVRDDIVGRTMLLIADGVVEREGVSGLAKRVHLGERQLLRILRTELGAGPQSLARAQRAQNARILIEATNLKMSEIAFAAGFHSVRQFNDTVRAVFASSPTELRKKKSRSAAPGAPGTIALRLPYRDPFDSRILGFFSHRLVSGIEEMVDGTYRRTLRLPHGPAVAELTLADGFVECSLRLRDLRDLQTAVQACRRVLDLDADPQGVVEHLARDEDLRKVVTSRPGLRIPGSTDGTELAMRAVLGQQVSVAGAVTLAGRLVAAYGKPLTSPDGNLTHVWPDAETIADASLEEIGMPQSRKNALRVLAAAIANEEIVLAPGVDRIETQESLVALPGIGPWTASYISMRALGDPDAFLPSDLGVKKGLEAVGLPSDPRSASDVAERWRPWRSYAVQYLWASLDQAQ